MCFSHSLFSFTILLYPIMLLAFWPLSDFMPMSQDDCNGLLFMGATVESPLLSADNCLICVYKFCVEKRLLRVESYEGSLGGLCSKGCEKISISPKRTLMDDIH